MKAHSEILEIHLPKRYYGHEAIANAKRAMSEVEQQTREEMFEFVRWKEKEIVNVYGGYMFLYAAKIEPCFQSIRGLFDYWKQLKK